MSCLQIELIQLIGINAALKKRHLTNELYVNYNL